MADDGNVSQLEQAQAERRARNLGERVRLRRTEVGATQEDVGAIAGVHRATIRAVETGKSVEERTLANVKRALACHPGELSKPPDPPSEMLKPVLSSRATAILVQGILREESEDERKTLISDYFDLVNELSRPHGHLPPTHGRFLGSLASLIAPPDWELVDKEIRDMFLVEIEPDQRPFNQAPPDVLRGTRGRPVTYQPSYVRARASWSMLEPLVDDLAAAVERSGLPLPLQKMIIDAAASRQTELRRRINDQLAGEVGAIVTAAGNALRSVADQLGAADDDLAVQDTVAKFIAEIIRITFRGR